MAAYQQFLTSHYEISDFLTESKKDAVKLIWDDIKAELTKGSPRLPKIAYGITMEDFADINHHATSIIFLLSFGHDILAHIDSTRATTLQMWCCMPVHHDVDLGEIVHEAFATRYNSLGFTPELLNVHLSQFAYSQTHRRLALRYQAAVSSSKHNTLTMVHRPSPLILHLRSQLVFQSVVVKYQPKKFLTDDSFYVQSPTLIANEDGCLIPEDLAQDPSQNSEALQQWHHQNSNVSIISDTPITAAL